MTDRVSDTGTRLRTVLPAVAVMAMLLLGGCSTLGDGLKSVASALNPVNWFSEEEPDYKAGETVVAKKPGKPDAKAKRDDTRPPLSSVPDRPRRLTSSRAKAERKDIQNGLAADAANARYSEEALRAARQGDSDAATSHERVQAMTPPAPAAIPAATIPAGVSSRQASLTPNVSMRTVQVATIYFGDGSAALSNLDRQVVRQVAAVARRTGGIVRIIGHSSVGAATADSRSHDGNYKVSLKRAEAVATELRRRGVSGDQVKVIARGDSEPVYLETASTGAAGNRRVEVYLDYFEGDAKS